MRRELRDAERVMGPSLAGTNSSRCGRGSLCVDISGGVSGEIEGCREGVQLDGVEGGTEGGRVYVRLYSGHEGCRAGVVEVLEPLFT